MNIQLFVAFVIGLGLHTFDIIIFTIPLLNLASKVMYSNFDWPSNLSDSPMNFNWLLDSLIRAAELPLLNQISNWNLYKGCIDTKDNYCWAEILKIDKAVAQQ